MTKAEYAIRTLYARTSNGDDEGAISRGMSEIELTIALFQTAPTAFCIEGYPQYPDRKAVSALMYGYCKERGLTESTGRPGFVRLTMKGLELGAKLMQARKTA